jgi:anti-sigma regulatory factor (Ser/Thr protein kinase)
MRGVQPQTARATERETWLPAAASSAGEARSIVSDAAAEAGLDPTGIRDLMLATSEAVANAVLHGEAWPNGCILLRTGPCAGGLRVEVCDCGTFDSELEPAPLDATCGRGVLIIAAVVDHVEVLSRNGSTRVCFERHAAGA